MHLDRKLQHSVRFYSLAGEVISSVSEAKYLGVLLSDKYGTRSSQWKAHITEKSTKASQRFNFLCRNLRGCPYKLRELGYISLVRSSLEYCGAIWDTTIKDEVGEDPAPRCPLDTRSTRYYLGNSTTLGLQLASTRRPAMQSETDPVLQDPERSHKYTTRVSEPYKICLPYKEETPGHH